MSRKTFQVATDASTVYFDLEQSKNWQVTLGGNRTLTFANASKGDLVAVLLVQDGTGSRVPVWTNVTWQSGQAPTLRTAAGAVDLIELVYDGNVFRDVAGSPSRLPTRITDRGLSTIALIGATAGIVLNLSAGSGEAPGNLPDALRLASNSGAQINTVINGTGSVAIGSGYLVVGSLKDDSAAKFKVTNNGTTTVKAAVSGASITLNGGRAGKTSCYQTGGTLSYCQAATDANGCACK